MKIVYRLDGELHEAAGLEAVPDIIDRLIAFHPDYPPAPHSASQHAAIMGLTAMLAELLERER